jgi:hypothetical protein
MFWEHEYEARNIYDKIKVVAACHRTLASLRSKREAKHQEQIEREMLKRKFFFGPLFTRDEAIHRLKEIVGITSEWGMVEAMYGRQERTCESILYAASNTIGNGFWLTLSEANSLHWERP